MSETNPDASPPSSHTRRLLRWGGGVLGGLAVLVLIAALVLPRLFTSEQLKGYVIPPLEEATGRQVEIETIGLRVLPMPAIRIGGFRLANAEGYGPSPAVEARALNVDVALLPLFLAQIRPTAVGLERPVIRYEIAKDGTTNFDDLLADSDTAATDEPLLGGIPLSNVRVSEAQLHYADRSTDQGLRLHFDAQFGVIADRAALTSDGTVTLQAVRALLPSVSADTLTVRDARVDYDVRVTPSMEEVNLRTLRLQTAPLTLTAQGTVSKLNEQPTVDLSIETGDTNLGNIASFIPAAAVEGLNPRGTLGLQGTVTGPLPIGESTLEALSVAATGQLKAVGVDYNGTALLRDLSADLSFSLDDVALRSMDGQLLGASLAGNVSIRQFQSAPTVEVDLQTGRMNLSDLVAFVPPEQVESYSPQGRLQLDFTAAGPLPTDVASLEEWSINGTGQLEGGGVDYGGRELVRALSAGLSFSSDAIAVQSVQGQLLGASVAGRVAVRQFRTTPQIDLDVETGPMSLGDLIAFMPPEQRGTYNPQGTLRLDVSAKGPMPSDAEKLQKWAVNGTGQLAGFGMDVEERALLRSLKADLQFAGTTVSARGIDGRLFDRPLSGEVTVRDPWGMPQVEGQLAGVADLEQLTTLAGNGSSSSVQGTAEYDLRFVGPLETPDAIRPTGRVRLTKVQVPYESFRTPIEIPDATLQLTGTGLSMDRAPVRSGDQTAMLRTTIENLFPLSKGLADTNPTLSATFQFTSDRIDLEALYPEVGEADVSYSDLFSAQLAGATVKGQSPEALAEELYGDVELPAYAVDGRVEIGTLLNEPQQYTDLAFDVQMDDRRLAIRNIEGATYGGTLSGTFTLDQRQSASAAIQPEGTVRFASAGTADRSPRATRRAPQSDASYDIRLQGADAGTVLRDWTSLGELVTGTLTLTAEGKSSLTPGLLPQPEALSAVGESVVADGGVGVDFGPASVLVEALGLPAAPLRNFKRLGGPFVIENGQLQVQSWGIETDQFDGTVEGGLGLGGGLDLRVTLNLPLAMIQKSGIVARVGGANGSFGEVLKKLLGTSADDETVPVTVRIQGTMRDPTVQVLDQDALRSRIETLAKEAGLKRLRDLFGGGGGSGR